MKKSVTMKDVAAHANVSASTVSRVINGKIDEDAPIARAVLRAAEELNYRPNAAARFMKGQSTGTIGMILPDIAIPFFTGIASGAITRAQKNNNNIIIASSNGCIQQEKRSLEHLSRSVLDGLIYCPIARNGTFHEIEYFKNIPVVVAYRRDVIPNRPQVYVDNIKGGYMATKYMLRLNRKRICFLAGFWDPPNDSASILEMSASSEAGFYTTLDRFKGYLKALEEEGIPYDPSLVFITKYSHDSGYHVTREIISKVMDIEGILAPNDLVASGAIKFLTEQGISVPEDISVIGYDDSLIAEVSTPSITSINQNSHEVGTASVDMMLDLLKGKKVKDHIVDVNLSIRKSTAFLKEK